MSGCYKIPAVQTDIVGVFTNKCPTDAIRGAGRPEATHMIEVTLDQMAAELGMDPLEIRRKNFIPKEDFPAEVAIGIIYDSGDYDKTLDRLLEHVDVPAFRREQEELRGQGIYRGIGFSHLHRDLRSGPVSSHRSRAGSATRPAAGSRPWSASTTPARSPPTRAARPTARATRRRSRRSSADRLGVDPAVVEVIHGDTGTGPEGRNTYGSRSLAVGGEALAKGATKIADKAKAIVAHNLEAAPEDIELVDGQVHGPRLARQGNDAGRGGRRGVPQPGPRGDGARAGGRPRSTTRRTSCSRSVPTPAIVDVDPETGKVKVLRYVAVDDCGNAINPLLIDGQVHGGIVHAIGQALYERVHYDEDGQLVTGTFVDYALPTAAELPSFETDRTVTPSPVNSLGVKGVGEAGTIAASATVTNAVIDALRPLGVSYINMPLSPMRVWEAISEAKGKSANGGAA